MVLQKIKITAYVKKFHVSQFFLCTKQIQFIVFFYPKYYVPIYFSVNNIRNENEKKKKNKLKK